MDRHIHPQTGVSFTIYRYACVRQGGLRGPGGLLPAGSTVPSADDTERFERLRRTSRIQLVFAGLFFVAFLIYLPIGLAIVDDFKHLTIAEVCGFYQER